MVLVLRGNDTLLRSSSISISLLRALFTGKHGTVMGHAAHRDDLIMTFLRMEKLRTLLLKRTSFVGRRRLLTKLHIVYLDINLTRRLIFKRDFFWCGRAVRVLLALLFASDVRAHRSKVGNLAFVQNLARLDQSRVNVAEVVGSAA